MDLIAWLLGSSEVTSSVLPINGRRAVLIEGINQHPFELLQLLPIRALETYPIIQRLRNIWMVVMCCFGQSSCQWDFYHIIREYVKCASEKKLHVLCCPGLTHARVWTSSPRMPYDAVLALVSFLYQLLANGSRGKFWVRCSTSASVVFVKYVTYTY